MRDAGGGDRHCRIGIGAFSESVGLELMLFEKWLLERQGDGFNSGTAYSISVALPRFAYVMGFGVSGGVGGVAEDDVGLGGGGSRGAA